MRRSNASWRPAATARLTRPPNANEEPTIQLDDEISDPSSDARIGSVVDGRYRIVSLLAQGGMGKVYRAEQHPLGRLVALKVLDVGQGSGPAEEFRERFMLEACTTARLTHPNTVRVFDSGRFGQDDLYIAMELLEGRTLNEVIRGESPLSAERILTIFKQICGSLREAHQLGLIHRDLKPNNVILTRPLGGGAAEDVDFVRVLDFGLVTTAHATLEPARPDTVVGSPSFMSPEQIRNRPLDGRSDIYSLGVMMYASIFGRVPFTGTNPQEIMLAHLHDPLGSFDPTALAMSECPTLEWVVRTCLEKDPASRFATVDELLRALRQCDVAVGGERAGALSLRDGRVFVDGRVVAPADVPLMVQVEIDETVEPPRPERAHSRWIGAAIALAVVGVAAIGLAWVGFAPSAPESPIAAAASRTAETIASPPAPSEPAVASVATPAAEQAPPELPSAGAAAPEPAEQPVARVEPTRPTIRASTAPARVAPPPKKKVKSDAPPSDLRDPWTEP